MWPAGRGGFTFPAAAAHDMGGRVFFFSQVRAGVFVVHATGPGCAVNMRGQAGHELAVFLEDDALLADGFAVGETASKTGLFWGALAYFLHICALMRQSEFATRSRVDDYLRPTASFFSTRWQACGGLCRGCPTTGTCSTSTHATAAAAASTTRGGRGCRRMRGTCGWPSARWGTRRATPTRTRRCTGRRFQPRSRRALPASVAFEKKLVLGHIARLIVAAQSRICLRQTRAREPAGADGEPSLTAINSNSQIDMIYTVAVRSRTMNAFVADPPLVGGISASFNSQELIFFYYYDYQVTSPDVPPSGGLDPALGQFHHRLARVKTYRAPGGRS